jgi:hypothetical protein
MLTLILDIIHSKQIHNKLIVIINNIQIHLQI